MIRCPAHASRRVSSQFWPARCTLTPPYCLSLHKPEPSPGIGKTLNNRAVTVTHTFDATTLRLARSSRRKPKKRKGTRMMNTFRGGRLELGLGLWVRLKVRVGIRVRARLAKQFW